MATKRTKGGAFERQMSSRLSMWWSGETNDDLCWRTSGSGGRATRRGDKRTLNHYGDIGPTDDQMRPFFQAFCVELKFGYSKHSPSDILDSLKGYGQLGKWWDKLSNTTQKAGARWPMMIWRRNGREEIVIIPKKAARSICSDLDFAAHIKMEVGQYHLHLTTLDIFLSVVSPKDVARLAHA